MESGIRSGKWQSLRAQVNRETDGITAVSRNCEFCGSSRSRFARIFIFNGK